MAYASNRKESPRAFGCVFLPFFVLGLFFLVMIVREVIASASTYTWQAAPCRMIESEVRGTGDNYGWFAYLRYEWDTGESIRSSRPFASYREALRFTHRWPAGSSTTCYLDPRDPAGALLERKSSGLGLALFIPLPLLFMLIGGAGFYFVAFRKQPQIRVRPPANPAAGRRIVAALLMAMGTIISLAILGGPVSHLLAARSWRAGDCTVIRSQILEHHGSKGAISYSPGIFYSYMAKGQEHRSDTYSFFYGSGGWDSAMEIIHRYRPGSTVSCDINPADPDDAVLHREPTLGWLVGLAPLVLVAAGAALWRRLGRQQA